MDEYPNDAVTIDHHDVVLCDSLERCFGINAVGKFRKWMDTRESAITGLVLKHGVPQDDLLY